MKIHLCTGRVNESKKDKIWLFFKHKKKQLKGKAGIADLLNHNLQDEE